MKWYFIPLVEVEDFETADPNIEVRILANRMAARLNCYGYGRWHCGLWRLVERITPLDLHRFTREGGGDSSDG